MFFKKKRLQKRGFRSLFSLLCWWKSRRFYVAQVEEVDEDGAVSAGGCKGANVQQPECAPTRNREKMHRKEEKIPPQYPFERSTTMDSFQGSIESIDSLVESYWDPEDETSQVTALISNTGGHPDFLTEHLSFLSAQTQPREVEVVYRETYMAQ